MVATNDRFKSILSKLLEKSRKDEVHWEIVQKDPDPSFKVSVLDPKATILVQWFSPDVEPDWGRAELLVDGNVVSQLTAEDGGRSDDLQLLRDIWQDAHRCVFGWDNVLEKLENVLQSEGTVGSPF
jgi:hypothetical protein